MAKRRCRHCPTLVPADTYKDMCPACRRATDQARGGRTERGYGAAHQAERATYIALIKAGTTVRCVTCNAKLDTTLHLGHNDARTDWIGPQCAFCNDSQAGTKSHPAPE